MRCQTRCHPHAKEVAKLCTSYRNYYFVCVWALPPFSLFKCIWRHCQLLQWYKVDTLLSFTRSVFEIPLLWLVMHLLLKDEQERDCYFWSNKFSAKHQHASHTSASTSVLHVRFYVFIFRNAYNCRRDQIFGNDVNKSKFYSERN